MIFNRLPIISAVISAVIVLTSCNAASPPFESGIRFGAFLANPVDPTGDTVPVGGGYDSGTWSYAMSGITHGTDKSFSGSTRLTDGYDDHPNAEDNSVWYLYMDFAFAEPDCGVLGPGRGESPGGATVPDGGAVFKAICIL